MRQLLLAALIGMIPWAPCGSSSPWQGAPAASLRGGAEAARPVYRTEIRNWKRGKRTVLRRTVRPQARANKRAPWAPGFNWSELTLQCLLSQPFVICP